MTTEADIRRLLNEYTTRGATTVLGRVTDVDAEKRTCTIDDDGVSIYNVRLQSITGGKAGVVMKPKTGSYVVAIDVEGRGDWAVVLTTEVESIEIKIEERSVTMNAEGVIFNGGRHGMVKVDEMTRWMELVHQDLQTLTTLLSTSTVAGNGAPLGIAFVPKTTKPEQSTFEDTTIKH